MTDTFIIMGFWAMVLAPCIIALNNAAQVD